jgi:hypothetical protein
MTRNIGRRGLSASALLVGLLCATSALADSVKVEASQRSISDDEDVQITFSFDGQGQGQIPDLADWNIVGQNQGTSIQIINGQMTRSTSQTYVLTPKRVGNLVIAPATIVRDGQVVAQSQPLTIVVRGAQAMKPSEAKSQAGDEDISFVTEVSRDHVYVGEPFTVTGVIYVAARLSELDVAVQEVNAADSIQREDVMPPQQRFRHDGERTFKGRTFTRFIVFQEAWRVLRPETIAVPALRAQLVIQTRRTMFGEQFRAKSVPVTVEVRAVPAAGRPATYREGAIGQFQVTGSLTPDQARSRAVLEVVVAGQGSLKTLDPPTLPPVAGASIEPLPSDERDKYDATADGVTGQRVFQFLVTPQRGGVVQLPPISYTWFDPDKQTFETGATPPMQYDAAAGVLPAQKVDPDRPALRKRELKPIATSVSIAAPPPVPLHRRVWFVGGLGAPLALFFAIEAWAAFRRRADRDSGKTKTRKALAVANKRVHDARSDSREHFFSDIARALRSYVEDRHGLALTGLTQDAMRAVLGSRGHRADTIERFITELEACDFARFAPSAGTADEMVKVRDQARALLAALEAER